MATSRRVVVQFREEWGGRRLPLSYRDGAEEDLRRLDLGGAWDELSERHPGITLRTLVRDRSGEKGADQEIASELSQLTKLARARAAEQRSHVRERRIPDLRTAFFLQTRGDARDLAARLRRWPGVELAYWDPPGHEPGRSDNPEAVNQLYLDPAPLGLGAESAWSEQGGQGQGVGLVDLERGWDTTHPDLPKGLNVLVGTSLPPKADHGTQTLGVTSAVDNEQGVIGVAPAAAPVGLASWDDTGAGSNGVENAIYWSLKSLRRGDVLLLEVQKGDGVYLNMPAESLAWIHIWVSIASLLGVVVVAAAGNGDNDLDKTGNRWVDATAPDHHDSGSILVGAALRESDSLVNVQWKRWTELAQGSNHGARVSSFGMASGVWTTKGASSYGSYGGTSAAAAMVAGAALALQGATEALHGRRFSPAQMRALLAKTGTPTLNAADGIGVMPDLAKLVVKMKDEEPGLQPGPVLA